jgi:hypothetical protein
MGRQERRILRGSLGQGAALHNIHHSDGIVTFNIPMGTTFLCVCQNLNAPSRHTCVDCTESIVQAPWMISCQWCCIGEFTNGSWDEDDEKASTLAAAVAGKRQDQWAREERAATMISLVFATARKVLAPSLVYALFLLVYFSNQMRADCWRMTSSGNEESALEAKHMA